MAGWACTRRTSTMITSATGTTMLAAREKRRNPSTRPPRRCRRSARIMVATRGPAPLGRFLLTVEAVADAAHRRDVERRPAHELLAQPADVHVHGLAVSHELVAPD